MAEAFLRQIADKTVEATSAGTIPSSEINPLVTMAMLERGIDISHNKPKVITQEMVNSANRIVTMGCYVDESCPAIFIPSEDWGLEDPQGKGIEDIRLIRDKIEEKTTLLWAELQ